jgi:hypothetical protein
MEEFLISYKPLTEKNAFKTVPHSSRILPYKTSRTYFE